MRKNVKMLLMAMAICFSLSLGVNATSAATKVTGLKQTGASSSSVEVSCNPVMATGTVYYALQLSTDNVNWATKDTTTSVNGISCSGLAAGMSYYARVALTTGYGETKPIVPGTASDPIEVVTAPDASGFTTGQTDATMNSVTIAASECAGANCYKVLGDNDMLIATSDSPVITVPNLLAGTRYWIYVHPCRRSSTGFEAYEKYQYDMRRVTTLCNAVPKSGLSVTDAYYNINVYYFGFTSPGEYDGYELQFAKPNGSSKKTFVDNNRISGYINGKLLKYRVRTYVNCGTQRAYSGWSAYRTLGYVSKITGKLVNNKKAVKITWSKMSGASGYNIYTSTKEKKGYKKIKSVSAKTKSITISKVAGKKLKKNKHYYVKVVPKYKSGKKTYLSETFAYYDFRIY